MFVSSKGSEICSHALGSHHSQCGAQGAPAGVKPPRLVRLATAASERLSRDSSSIRQMQLILYHSRTNTVHFFVSKRTSRSKSPITSRWIQFVIIFRRRASRARRTLLLLHESRRRPKALRQSFR